jgi:hypothetical protein
MKTLYIIRGLPGSGKSTLARILVGDFLYREADQFMVDEDGNYKFDPTKLGEAHKWCQDEIRKLMKEGIACIAVSNTFCQEWEMEPYLAAARRNMYSVQVLTCEGQFGSIHGVPTTTVKAMRLRWEDGRVRAWFQSGNEHYRFSAPGVRRIGDMVPETGTGYINEEARPGVYTGDL